MFRKGARVLRFRRLHRCNRSRYNNYSLNIGFAKSCLLHLVVLRVITLHIDTHARTYTRPSNCTTDGADTRRGQQGARAAGCTRNAHAPAYAGKGSRAGRYPPERIAAIWDDLDALDGSPAEGLPGGGREAGKSKRLFVIG